MLHVPIECSLSLFFWGHQQGISFDLWLERSFGIVNYEIKCRSTSYICTLYQPYFSWHWLLIVRLTTVLNHAGFYLLLLLHVRFIDKCCVRWSCFTICNHAALVMVVFPKIKCMVKCIFPPPQHHTSVWATAAHRLTPCTQRTIHYWDAERYARCKRNPSRLLV